VESIMKKLETKNTKKPVCPHCGDIDMETPLDTVFAIVEDGKATSIFECGYCSKNFAVTVGFYFSTRKVK
jgi:transcription elongation factor Elf1